MLDEVFKPYQLNQPFLGYIFPSTIKYKKMMKWTQERQIFGSNFPHLKSSHFLCFCSFFFIFFYFMDARHMSNKRFKSTKQAISKTKLFLSYWNLKPFSNQPLFSKPIGPPTTSAIYYQNYLVTFKGNFHHWKDISQWSF